MKVEFFQYIELLLQFKIYVLLKIKLNSEWDWSEWEFDLIEVVKNGIVLERVFVFFDFKFLYRSYKEVRFVIWDVF